MARRKNTKFIDPRYFMDEKMERLDEWGDTRHQDMEMCDDKVPMGFGRNSDEYKKCLDHPEAYEPPDPAEHELNEKQRSAKGNITQDTREETATVGKDKFPIFDKKSAKAAIDLRGHAPEADRSKIINKAAKYAPAAAKKAREADKK